jgi:outer membrane lipoprotein-sorting protein
MKIFCITSITAIAGFLYSTLLIGQDATEIIKRADDKMRGEKSSIAEMSLKIVRPTWERTISFKNWTKGTDNSMVLITAPAKDAGQSFLKLGNEMWNWNPTIARMIKLPPSMLSQGWMGSDYTNDDLLNQRSIVSDYSHSIVGTETLEGHDCYKIQLMPKEDAQVVWGKLLFWVTKTDDNIMKMEYYDEDDVLVKTESAHNIKNMDGRLIPTEYELIPADEEGKKTIVEINSIKFNVSIDDTFFSQQNMKRLH